jgi:predicted nucleotidyltransferase
MVLTKEIISEIKETLIGLGVEKVILFGSYAYGIPDIDSDIDILAIKSTSEQEVRPTRLMLKKALWEKLCKYNIPFDLIVDDEQRIQSRIEMGDQFYKEIYSKGKIINA